MLLQAVSAVSNGADAATVWSAFDNDGPDGLANSGDDDGVVDFVTFLQPDRDGACGTAHLWSHRFVLSAFNGGSPYVTRTPWQGHPGQFLKLNDYILQSAVGGSTGCDDARIMPIGTMAHETGHAFGLPDLYDTGDPSTASEGIGEWGLMGSGNYAMPYSPSRMEAWSMAELGWIALDSLSASGTVVLDPVSSSHRATFVGVPGTDEYFLLENRQDLQSDSAQMNPARGARAKLPGLLVWHIDEGQVEAHGFSGDNRVNALLPHGVELLQADGRGNLDASASVAGSNRGDAGDSYPGSSVNRRITLSSVPAALDNQRQYTGFVIDSIYQMEPHGRVAFRFTRRQPDVFAASPAGARIRVNGVSAPSLADVVLPGDSAMLSADSVQAAADGRSRFEFRSWSDGAALAHVFHATATPSAITATFSAEYRLLVQLVNALPGAVTLAAPPPGADLAAGVFLASGASVTLTATPPAGTVFGGWHGDTTALSPTLTLTMGRAYNVSATFLAQVAVDVNAAANALLGTGALTAEQITYLDSRGNQDGAYDLGDFLAFIKFSGVSPSAGVMRQVLSHAPAHIKARDR
jgi:M6 family metalloprotease-like protein